MGELPQGLGGVAADYSDQRGDLQAWHASSRAEAMETTHVANPPASHVSAASRGRCAKSFASTATSSSKGVGRAQLADLTSRIRDEFDRTKGSGRLFVGGGTLSGHLNCFPGKVSRFVYGQLQAVGIIELIRALSDTPLRAPNIG